MDEEIELTVIASFNPNDGIVGQDPCVCVEYAGARLCTTTAVDANAPRFIETLGSIVHDRRFGEIIVSVRNRRTGNLIRRLPTGRFPLDTVLAEGNDEPALQLLYGNERGEPPRDAGEIRIRMQYRRPDGGDQQQPHPPPPPPPTQHAHH